MIYGGGYVTDSVTYAPHSISPRVPTVETKHSNGTLGELANLGCKVQKLYRSQLHDIYV